MARHPAAEALKPYATDEAGVLARYAKARANGVAGVATVLLDLGAERCAIAIGTGAAPDAIRWLEIGHRRIARESFRHTPPSAGDWEAAIQTVEDALAPVRAMLPEPRALAAAGAHMARLADLAGGAGPSPRRLSGDAVERLFNALLAPALGRPLGAGLPDDADFAATVLILRESLHHLGFAELEPIGDD